METYMLRKGSRGLAGSFKNAEHHAQAAVPLMHAMLGVINSLSPYIKSWGQGHNIHVLESHDGRKIALRPFYSNDDVGNEKWGIEIRIQVSRTVEIPIMTFDRITRTRRAYIVMRDFFKVKKNYYGRTKEQEEEKTA